ncbi:C39 family peptidase [Cytobacillus sp. FJAT-54145]|uniref:C39 family peptidase n=1 Tax=Cytobacillus spartinae TaxID=3299023 RepID=A0ABW6KGE6_9BACI
MNILFLIIGLLLLLFIYLLIKVRKGTGLLKSSIMFLSAFLIIVIAFIFENSKTTHIANAVESIKLLWVQTPVEKTNTLLDKHSAISIIKIKDEVLLDAPAINQFPELPRGCEVTSLAMLLQYTGINVDKMTLAEKVKKDPTPYKVENGKVYFGHPNVGFVGNMYTFDEKGYGVYHKPIKELAETYLPNQITDLTGSGFEEIKIHLSDDRPVWVITNTTYKKLPKNYFQTWYTPIGEVNITLKEHSVLITGYDQQFIYFNDPLTGEKNKKAPLVDFEESWVQMGRQAITYLPKE